jgi:parallel beta-helix repeat protein
MATLTRPTPGQPVHRRGGRALAGASIALLFVVTAAIGLPALLSPPPANQPPTIGVVPGNVTDPGGSGLDSVSGTPAAASAGPSAVVPADVPSSTPPPAPTGPTTNGTGHAPPAGAGTPTKALPSSPNRWVASTGSDSADGSASHPWRTIQHAVDVTPFGGVITVHAGSYGHFAVKRSGLVVQGASGESAIVSGGTYVVLLEGVSNVTIRHLTIQKAPDQWGSGIRIEASRNVRVENSLVRDNHSFGIKVKDATGVRITNNEIRGNDTGIELSGSVGGTVIAGNRIHHNNRMVTSSRGGNGVVFTKTSGLITVSGNLLWGNRARHLTDSGYDGGAFEVYAASDLRITGNVMWDNNNVMETGTDGSAPCSHITFTRNIAYGPGTVANETQGLILRCASSSLFANNTFDGLDTFAFYLTASGSYAGSIGGLRIENNVVLRGRSYSLNTGLPGNVVIDYNLAFPGGSSAEYADHLAYVEGRGNTDSLAEFRSWTGYDAHGVQANPRFVDRAHHNYRLTLGSPAIDAGARIGSAFVGKAPDIGRYERGV